MRKIWRIKNEKFKIWKDKNQKIKKRKWRMVPKYLKTENKHKKNWNENKIIMIIIMIIVTNNELQIFIDECKDDKKGNICKKS